MDSTLIVLGGGPAGVLTAVLLARRGYEMRLLTADRPRPRIEGLSQRVVDVLAAQGLHHALDAVGPEVPRQANWGGERGPRNVEFATERSLRCGVAARCGGKRRRLPDGADDRTGRRLATDAADRDPRKEPRALISEVTGGPARAGHGDARRRSPMMNKS